MFDFLKTAVRVVVSVVTDAIMGSRAPVTPSVPASMATTSTPVETAEPTKAIEAPKPAPVACKDGERICKDCHQPFKPVLQYYRICPSCFSIWLKQGKQPVVRATTVEAPRSQLPSEKDVMRAWAKEVFEADHLPEDAKIVHGKSGKITVTLDNQCVVFHSDHRPSQMRRPESTAAQATVEKRVITEALQNGPTAKRCAKCTWKFIPAREYFQVCPACHAKQTAKPMAKSAPPPPMSERELQASFARSAKTSYEAGALPAEAKVTERKGGQVVISALGRSMTFISEQLRQRQQDERAAEARRAADKRQQDLCEENERREWIINAFEANELPEDSEVKSAGEGRITVTCNGMTITFSSKKLIIPAEVVRAAQQPKRGSQQGSRGNKGKPAAHKKAA